MNPPPFLVSFPDARSLKAALSPGVIEAYWSDAERLIERGLPPAVSVRVLACLFGFSARFIEALSRKPERYYRTFRIKKGKRLREIHAPRVGLKVVQKWLGYHLAAALKFDDSVYGFVVDRSAPMAAAVHCGAAWVYSLDIAGFFPTTSATRVASALEGIGYPAHGASLISSLCCFGGNLAQGSPASPVLSNLVFSPWDVRLKKIAAEAGCRYSRYVDDMVFSGKAGVPQGLQRRVRAVIDQAGWEVSKGKEHLAQLPHRLKVHGLLVHGGVPRLTKGYRNRIRGFSHLVETGRVCDEDMARFKGHLAYAQAIEKMACR